VKVKEIVKELEAMAGGLRATPATTASTAIHRSQAQ